MSRRRTLSICCAAHLVGGLAPGSAILLGCGQSNDIPLAESNTALSAVIISGRVTGANGAALDGVTITVNGSAQSTTTTTPAGQYALSVTRHGSYSLRSTLAGCTFTPDTVNLNNVRSSLVQDRPSVRSRAH